MDKFSKKIQTMFGAISGRYDFMNRLLSGCLDIFWRRNFVTRALKVFSDIAVPGFKPRFPVIADIASGTGDVTIEFIKQIRRGGIFRDAGPVHICCSDFSLPMLSKAREKIARLPSECDSAVMVSFVICDARHSCFKDSSFDMAFIAFGLRNFSDLPDFVERELGRVMKKRRAVAAILEFNNIFKPDGFVTKSLRLFQIYYNFFIGLLAAFFSTDASAYEYLVNSIKRFPPDDLIIRHLLNGKFQSVRYKRIFPYVVSRYIAIIK